MRSIHARLSGQPPQRREGRTRWLLLLVALAVFIELSVLLVYWWPFPYLGYRFDLASQHITAIEPGSAADLGGLQTGDRIIELYGRPWSTVVHHWNVLEFAGPLSQPVVVKVVRDRTVVTTTLHQQPPTFAFQLMKLTTFLLALVCWLTGLVLGIVRRHDIVRSPVIGLFWLVTGGVLGTFIAARYISIPAMTLLEWLMLTLLLPWGVYIHLWFPARPVGPATIYTARQALLVGWFGLTGAVLGGVLLTKPTLVELAILLGNVLPFALVLACAGAGVLLWRADHMVVVAHVRRQIWLIGLACSIVAAAWLCFLLVPTFTPQVPMLADRGIDLVAVLIPIAYLLGGVLPDLSRLDRLLTYLAAVVIAVALTLLCIVIIGWFWVLAPLNIALFGALGIMLFYPGVIRLMQRLVPVQVAAGEAYRSLASAVSALTTSLDRDVLSGFVMQGVRTAFHDPACALYLRAQDSNHLMVAHQFRLPDLPPTLGEGTLTSALRETPARWCETRTLRSTLAADTLGCDERAVLYHADIALWCPITDAAKQLLAVLVLGVDGTHDPYRAADMREIESFVVATSLALRNSAAYEQRCAAEATIRHLYRELHESQAKTAAVIARELHDEIINIHIRLNVQSLEYLSEAITNPEQRAELLLLLESEQTMGEALRMVCEQLRPTASDDPLGLPGLLRVELDRVAASWPGVARLDIVNEPLPVSRQAQQAAVLITREAVVNAMKHAAACTITVTVRYPLAQQAMIELSVQDDGQSASVVEPKAGHWGIHFMQESAASVEGNLEFARAQGGGTLVVFTFGVDS